MSDRPIRAVLPDVFAIEDDSMIEWLSDGSARIGNASGSVTIPARDIFPTSRHLAALNELPRLRLSPLGPDDFRRHVIRPGLEVWVCYDGDVVVVVGRNDCETIAFDTGEIGFVAEGLTR
jgi:hypothetical protein